jgi:hypothetical protein
VLNFINELLFIVYGIIFWKTGCPLRGWLDINCEVRERARAHAFQWVSQQKTVRLENGLELMLSNGFRSRHNGLELWTSHGKVDMRDIGAIAKDFGKIDS